MLGSLWWCYKGLYNSHNQLIELNSYNDIDKVKYCMKNVSDDEWRRYKENFYSEEIETSTGMRRIGWENFRVSLQVQAIPDAFLSKIEPKEDAIPTISIIESNLKFLCSYGMGEDIWIWDTHLGDQGEIYWNEKKNEYIPNESLEKRLGISTDDIVSSLQENSTELTDIANQMMPPIISEKTLIYEKQRRYTIYITIFYVIVIIGGIWYYRFHKSGQEK